MAARIDATFDVSSWDEQPFDEGLGTNRLTRASVEKRYAGGITGSSATEWVMADQPDGTAAFVGMERITGDVGGRTGTLVLQHVGTFADGTATAALTVLSGTCALAGSEGTGTMLADPSGRVTLDLG